MSLTHINEQGHAKMVDVSTKDETKRIAIACATISMKPETFKLIMDKEIAKGDVLSVAQVAGIMAAKRTSEAIPMCHPLLLTGVDIEFKPDQAQSQIKIIVTVKTTGKTGVEMEALHGASCTALTIYDMCKAVDRGMTITDIYVMEKDGGKSGHYVSQS